MCSLFFKISAKGLQSAIIALWFACLAYVTAVEQKPMMCFGTDVGRDILDQLLLRL